MSLEELINFSYYSSKKKIVKYRKKILHYHFKKFFEEN
jgi:hypothetical protein